MEPNGRETPGREYNSRGRDRSRCRSSSTSSVSSNSSSSCCSRKSDTSPWSGLSDDDQSSCSEYGRNPKPSYHVSRRFQPAHSRSSNGKRPREPESRDSLRSEEEDEDEGSAYSLEEFLATLRRSAARQESRASPVQQEDDEDSSGSSTAKEDSGSPTPRLSASKKSRSRAKTARRSRRTKKKVLKRNVLRDDDSDEEQQNEEQKRGLSLSRSPSFGDDPFGSLHKPSASHWTYAHEVSAHQPPQKPLVPLVYNLTCGYQISDFDAMMLRKKEEKRKRHRKRDIDLINENDDLIDQMIYRMQEAAVEDRKLNLEGKPAIRKISMLSKVMSQLIKKDLQLAFLEHNILDVLTDWLAPLPNKSLPCIPIRESLLNLLADFPTIEKSYLKQSGIGKAVMYLYKHPQETKENRLKARRLICEWSRPIYNVSCEFTDMSKEERQARDLLASSQVKRKSPEAQEASENAEAGAFSQENASNSRARVPMPSNKVYLVRPKSNLDAAASANAADAVPTKKRKLNRFEVHIKRLYEERRVAGIKRPTAVSLSDATNVEE